MIEHLYKLTISTYTKVPKSKEFLRAHNENSFVDKTVALMDYLIVKKDIKTAKQIKQKGIAILPDDRFNKAVFL
jgi:hypothetical protein